MFFIASDDVYYRIELMFFEDKLFRIQFNDESTIASLFKKKYGEGKDGILQVGLRYLVKCVKLQMKAVLHGKMKRLSLNTMMNLNIIIRKRSIPQ